MPDTIIGSPPATSAAPAPNGAPAPATAATSPDMQTQFADLITRQMTPAAPVASVAQAAEPLAGKDIPATGSPASPLAGESPESGIEAPATDASSDIPLDLDADLADDASFTASGVIDPNSTKGQRLWAEHKFFRDLTASPDKGGLGHEPTVEDLRNYHGSHLTMERVQADLAEGSVRFLEGWGTVQPQALAEILQQLPGFLTEGMGAAPEYRETFEPVRQALYTSVLQSTVDSYMAAARETVDPKLKQELFNRAKFLAADFLEKDLSDSDLNVKVDPLAAERDKLAKERKRIDEHNAKIAAQAYQTFENRSMTLTYNNVQSQAKDFLKPFEKAPAFAAACKDLMTQAIAHVDQRVDANNELTNIHKAVQRALKSGQANEALMKSMEQRLAATILKYARPFMYQNRGNIVKQFGLTAQVPMAKKPTPAPGVGTPVQVSPASAPQAREAKEDFDSFGKRSLVASLSRLNVQ